MRIFLCKVMLLLVLLSSSRQAAAYDFGFGVLVKGFKIGVVAVAGLTVFGVFTTIRGCGYARVLKKPDFLQMQGGDYAVNHYSQISRYDVEKENPSVSSYLKIADKQDIGLTLLLRDAEGSSIATLVDYRALKKTVKIRYMAEDGGEVVSVPLTQVSGVALYEPDRYGRYVGVERDSLTPLYVEDATELSHFNKYHGIVLASFSDGTQLVRVMVGIDGDAANEEGWLMGFERGIDALVQNRDIIDQGL